MAVIYSKQYQRIGTNEVLANAPFTVRMAQDMASSINNYKRYVGNFKVRCALFPQSLSSAVGDNAERCVISFAPTTVPNGYNSLRCVLGHQRHNGTGSITWRIYSLGELYNNSAVFNAAVLRRPCAVASIVSNAAAYNCKPALTNGLVRDPSGATWLLVTAQSTDNSMSNVKSIDVWPVMD